MAIKKLIGVALCLIMVLSLSGCGGNTDEVKIVDVESKTYSAEDIESGMDVVKKNFDDKAWKGCTLKALKYAGDQVSEDHQDWADRNDLDQVMVFLSEFDVDESGGGEKTLNPNSTYTDFMWILARTEGGSWKVVDCGY